MKFSEYLTEVDWEGDFSDTKKSCISADMMAQELNDELARINTSTKDRKSRSPNAPIYTRGTIDKVIDKKGKLDVKKFIKLISEPPSKIFDQNPKMVKTDKGKAQLTVNTGLPAIIGVIYDKEEKQFYKINTCPGAGPCKILCYARKGFYGMNDGKALKLIRRLNLLMNDPNEYYNMIMDELEPTVVKLKRQGRRSGDNNQLVIRWNDAGDFFSQVYFNIAKRVTKELLDDGYNVKSYAYTKVGKYVNMADENFLINFSQGDASKKEEAKVDLEKTKKSIIVKKDTFNDIFVKKGSHFVKNQHGLPTFVENGATTLKRRIAAQYKVPVSTLKLQTELPAKEGAKHAYNVIVMPTGDTDIGAQRKDVQTTFLLAH